jgi:hypothetical protein
MSFLQPMLLAALPLVALPIIIHLINQRRYQTVQWAAMMFLLAANRMSRGYARIRQWLIMAFRMAAVAGLVFAISRPLAGGWLGVTASGRADTTIIVLDRSPSMQQGAAGGLGSKLETGTRQLVRALETLGSIRWVFVDGARRPPRELESPGVLLGSPMAAPTSAPADLPGLLEVARDYIKANKTGRTEVWICSDLRRNDWNPDDGRWRSLRESFLEFPQGVRFHLLAYPVSAPANLSLRVTDVRRQKAGDGAELLVSLRVTREGGDLSSAGAQARQTVPVQFEIAGARSEVPVEVVGGKFDLKDHRIRLERGRERGWGRVSIPADANPADNEYYFAFDKPAARRAIVVADDPQVARTLELAAATAPDPSVTCSAEVVQIEQLASVDWETASLLLWQTTLPEGDTARRVRGFVDRGGRVVFFPPRGAGGGEFLGVRWGSWRDGPHAETVENWRGDQDLLANTQSGASLPVGQIDVHKIRGLSGELTRLATLKGGAPLLARVTTNAGGAYFCATTPAPADSSLASQGVVLYVLIQRALAAGAEPLEGTRQLAAGEAAGDDPTRWKRLAGPDEAVSTDFALHRGVYASGERLLAVNRPAAEDAAPVLSDDRVAGLFRGLNFARVDDREGNSGALIQEVWRLFLVAMMAALVVEAALCLPKAAKARPAEATTGTFPGVAA